MSTSKHAAPKPLVSRPKQSQEVQSDEEEDVGRSGAFKSRKTNVPQVTTKGSVVDDDDHSGDETTMNEAPSVAVGHRPTDEEDRPLAVAAESNERRAKKPSNSYLDELLSKKSRKKKKSKHSTGS